MKPQGRVTKNVEVDREIPDLPDIPHDVIARFPSMAEYQRQQARAWYAIQLLLREMQRAIQS